MNNIDVLIRIIIDLGGSATSEAIVSEYCKSHHMVVQSHFKNLVEVTLSRNTEFVRFNHASHEWELKGESSSEEILTVSENRYFETIKDAMLQIFNKSVPLSQGYFKVDDEHMAWFPQPNNENWENTLSADGTIWSEKPKKNDVEVSPDYKPRYVFIHEKEGYRFTGLFILRDVADDRTELYELVDDKVQIVKPRPYLIVCRVAYMKYYDGITEDDVPINGGSYVTDNNDAYEKFNFLRYEDGNCYIFVETKYRSGHTAENQYARAINIEQINPSLKGKDHVDNVRVVLMAFSPIMKKNVVVGWYDNATIFRNRVVDQDKIYMMKCSYTDAHLIPENDRLFEIPRAQGNSFGIGQSNFWYIQKVDAARDFEDRLVDYIDSRV